MADTNEQVEASVRHELRLFLITWLSLPEVTDVALEAWADSEGYSDEARIRFVLLRLRGIVEGLDSVFN